MADLVVKYVLEDQHATYQACIDPAFGDRAYVTYWATLESTGHLVGYSKNLKTIRKRVYKKLGINYNIFKRFGIRYRDFDWFGG